MSSLLGLKRPDSRRNITSSGIAPFNRVGYGVSPDGPDIDSGNDSAFVRAWLDSLDSADRDKLLNGITANLRSGHNSDRYREFCARIIDAYRADFGITGAGHGYGNRDGHGHSAARADVDGHGRDTVSGSRGWLSPVGLLRWHLNGSGLPTWPTVTPIPTQRFPWSWGKG